jgi:quinolinate synthase
MAQVVLGTESGMVTAIVRKVQAMLREARRADVAVEIVFPVASEAITTAANSSNNGAAPAGAAEAAQLPGGLAVVPGPAGGEGCSAEGGCASCPYMKVGLLHAQSWEAYILSFLCLSSLLPMYSIPT